MTLGKSGRATPSLPIRALLAQINPSLRMLRSENRSPRFGIMRPDEGRWSAARRNIVVVCSACGCAASSETPSPCGAPPTPRASAVTCTRGARSSHEATGFACPLRRLLNRGPFEFRMREGGSFRSRYPGLLSQAFSAPSPANRRPLVVAADGYPGLPNVCLRGTRAAAVSRSAIKTPPDGAPRERDK